MEEGSLWGIATVIGPILLIVVIAYVIIRNRQSKVPRDVTERATHDLYQREEEARDAAENR